MGAIRAAWLWAVAVCGAADGAAAPGAAASNAAAPRTLEAADGYRGIWYANQPSKDEYRFKYSGGLATYPQQHAPIAIYRREVNRTFFVYGGTTARSATDKQELLHMVAWYDHATGTVPRPRILLDKGTADAHDNPVLSMDRAGYLWVFSPSHGTSRPSSIHRSAAPYSIEAFSRVYTGNFSYPNAWHLPDDTCIFLHTRYGGKGLNVTAPRCLAWATSRDGGTWSPGQALAAIAQGDYQISWPCGSRVSTAFDQHPPPLGLNARANVYYLETADGGATWTTADGQPVALPLTAPDNPARVYDSVAEGRLVYLKDLNHDAAGRPVILFLTSRSHAAGAGGGPREWQTLRWTGRAWERRAVTTSDSNYDHGSLYIEPDGAWRMIAPTVPGPQPFNPGGEMVMWLSRDRGATWTVVRQLTCDSRYNHTYARRPLAAHPGFYALWADGDARAPSPSSLYFTDRDGSHVWRLPETMAADTARPAVVGP